jgi:SNF2 family DNA or RNA helicase
MAGETRPTLVVAPLPVATNTWSDEAKKWDHLKHLKISAIVGDKSERLRALHTKADIYTINFENLPWLYEQVGDNSPFGTFIVDEASKLKGFKGYFRKKAGGGYALECSSGTRSIALAKMAWKKGVRYYGLTGTPCSNGLHQIWPLIWFIDGGKQLGNSYTAFENRWFKTGWNGFGLTALPHAESEIMDKIKGLVFTLRSEDYLDLPEEIENTVFVELPAKARQHYEEMAQELFTEIEAGEVEVFSAASKSAKLHQIANGSIYYDKEGRYEELHSAKLEAAQSIVDELNGKQVIIVYKFKSDLERLKKAFPKGRKFDKKPSTKSDFIDGKFQVLFIHPDSAGHGVDDLQRATNVMILYSLDWDGEKRQQVIARIGKVRQFQANTGLPAIIHQLVARDTIDEDILVRLEEKITVEAAIKRGLAKRGLK